MTAEWILQKKETKRTFNKSTWIPLKASQNNELGNCKEIGFKSEVFGCNSIAFPEEHFDSANNLGWSDIGLIREAVPYAYEDGYYSPVQEYEHSDKEPMGVNLIFDSPQPVIGGRKWIINPDIIIALRLVKQGDTWVRPEEDFAEVIKEHFDEQKSHTLIEIKKEFLIDYLSARNLNLRLVYYRQRVENVKSIKDSQYDSLDNHKEDRDGGEFELLIRDLDNVYGGRFSSMKVWRTDVDDEEDAPLMGDETDENTDYEQSTGILGGYEGVRVEGEFWRNEWIKHNRLSVRVRNDNDPSLPSYIVDTSGTRLPSHQLNSEGIGQWLFFKSQVINEILSHQGFSLEWYSAKTGGIHSTSGYKTHFGINDSDFITVYAYDIARLEPWEQHVWSAYNVVPDGKVSKELLDAQVRVSPANTYAVEESLFATMKLLENSFKDNKGIEIFSHNLEKAEFDKLIRRFNSTDLPSLLRLSKDLVRVFTDRLNVKELRTLSTHKEKKKLGSNKLIQDILAQKVGDEQARKMMGIIVGVYDLRLGDAHPTSSKINDALVLAHVDTSLSFLKQGEQLIYNFGYSIHLIGRALFATDN